MKIWLTPPFHDDGIEEVEFTSHDDGCLRFLRGGCRNMATGYVEGVDWHRTLAGAVDGARQRRVDRIARAVAEIARVNSLPPLRDLVGGARE